MKRLRQVLFTTFIFVALGSCGLMAWDQVITFNEFEAGIYAGPEAPIAQLVRVTRDEGFEEGRKESLARHHLADDGAGGLMYSLTTGGYGSTWGHVFAAIELERTITGEGTVYFQFALEGTGSDFFSVGCSGSVPNPMNPPSVENPWGWSGMNNWQGFTTQLRNANGAIEIREGGAYMTTEFHWTPGVWYEVWMTADPTSQRYRVHIRAPDAGILDQRVIRVYDGDMEWWREPYFFRHGADALRSIYFGMIAGDPDNPNVDHRWWINNIAVDFETANLGNPPVPLPGSPPPVDVRVFGFSPVDGTEFESMRANAMGMLGGDVWIAYAPYAYSMDLETWLFIPALADRNPERSNVAALRSVWTYIWQSPFPIEAWHFSDILGTWIYAFDGGWTFVWNSR